MNKLVAISDGHEIDTPGKRTPPIPSLGGRVIHENEFNHAVALELAQHLLRCGLRVINVSGTNNDSVADRVSRANSANADIYVSIHYNAYDGIFGGDGPDGLSVHIYAHGGEAEKLAITVHKYLLKGTAQKDKGIIVSNFYELNYSRMPAILTENGFMDDERESLLMINEVFRAEVAKEHAQGICEYFGITYIEEQSIDVSPWAQVAWEKAKKKLGPNGTPINDGKGAKLQVTEEQLMVFFDKLGLLD